MKAFKTYLSKFISFQLLVLLNVIIFYLSSGPGQSSVTQEQYISVLQVSFLIPELIVFLISFIKETPHFKVIDNLLKI